MDARTNALCDYSQAHHQRTDDTQEYTLKWELQTNHQPPSFFPLPHTTGQGWQNTDSTAWLNTEPSNDLFPNEGKLNENTFLTGTDFLDVFIGGSFVELFLEDATDSR